MNFIIILLLSWRKPASHRSEENVVMSLKTSLNRLSSLPKIFRKSVKDVDPELMEVLVKTDLNRVNEGKIAVQKRRER